MAMSVRHADGRRADRRAFRPTVGGLETKLLMAHLGKFGYLYPAGHVQTAFNGQAVDITTDTGQSFYIQVQGGGVVRAYPMVGGRWGLKLIGTNNQSVVTINPVVDSEIKQSAHTFNTRQTTYNGMINIGAISVVNGSVNDIEGYKTAVLSGPLIAMGTNPIDRLAFDAIAPGANIITGGDVNTLDVATSVILSGAGTGINIGRNLNFLSTFGDVDVINGANFIVGNDVGLTAQLAKGTGPSSILTNSTTLASTNINTQFSYQAFAIVGNVFIAPGSTMTFGGAIDSQLFVSGTFTGADKLIARGLRVLAENNNFGSFNFAGNPFFVTSNIPASPLPNGIYPFSLPSFPTN
jgi:hypothetical protein